MASFMDFMQGAVLCAHIYATVDAVLQLYCRLVVQQLAAVCSKPIWQLVGSNANLKSNSSLAQCTWMDWKD